MKNINAAQFQEMMNQDQAGLEVIDVREEYEFEEIKIKNSKNIPLGEIPQRKEEIDWNKKVILVCRSGARSAYAADFLGQEGKEMFNLDGGVGGLQLIDCKCLER
ncbi:MAG: rhodanese-like domain-containing protein [Candidatus Moranbacteria bacterium]|nr:rhodanese-like domain-containing protein [Candidatus Moranbacteria bacterium]